MFRKAYSYSNDNLLLSFLDTVGAYGIPVFKIGERFKYLEFYDHYISNIVNYACQALVIHERIALFKPCQLLKKSTWFPGVHVAWEEDLFQIKEYLKQVFC